MERVEKVQKKVQRTKFIKNSLLREIAALFLKIAVILLLFVLLFTLVFGIYRSENNAMAPAVKNGDIVLFYRLDKNAVVSEVVITEYNGQKHLGRVVATGGDTVNITSEGLVVNGALVNEREIYTETLPYTQGIKFPVTLAQNQVFLLADHRENSVDSRIYGPVDKDKILGKAATVVRRRGI